MLRAFAVCLCMTVVVTRADADAPSRRIVLTDLGLHVVGVGFQQTIAPRVALQLDLESYTPWTQEDQFFELQGFVVRARPFFYTHAAPTGWWLSPFAQAGVGSSKRDGARQSGLVWAAGASLGYAWLVWAHLHVAIGAGVQYDVARIPGGDTRPSFAELWLTLDGSLGFAF